MRNIINLFGFTLIFALLSNCEKEKTEAINNQLNQTILFQYEYINYAWGYQHAGWLIDSSGNVYCYKIPDNWIQCDSLGFISDSAMIINLNETDSICCKIDKNELKSKSDLIYNALKGEISKPIHEMCDAGVSIYTGFVFDNDTRLYKRIIFKQIGDFRIDNSSEDAKDLYNWLESIDKKIRRIE